MRHGTLIGGLLCAACSGGQKTAAPPPPVRPVAPVAEAPKPVAGPVDSHLAFRQSYANPGGMWMPQQMTLPGHVAAFEKLGVKVDPRTLADPLSAPLGAIVYISGCSASFVSAEGLIVTNHHCVDGPLQMNSTETNNLVETGFLAKTREDERPAGPAEKVLVIQAFTDVTKAVREGLDQVKDPVARKEALDKRIKQQIAACEKDRAGVRCDVKTYFRGGMFILFDHLEIRDVRLVYAPSRAIGNYGGEIDNWQWPRHTGDFAFYRAYVGKDGMPADYATENVPYRPKHFLRVSDKGVAPGDFVMAAGFPGTTYRTETAQETKHDLEWFYPYYIELAKQRYAIAEAHLASPGETAIKASVLKHTVQNGLEKYTGVVDGMTKSDRMQRKEALDKQIHDWAAAPGRERYKAAIAKLDQLIVDEQRTARVDYDRGVVLGGSKLLVAALTFTRWTEERTKPDAERKPGYQQRDLARALAAQKQLSKQYDRTLDRALFRLALVRALRLPPPERPWLATLLGAKRGAKLDEKLIDQTLAKWYGTTKLEDQKVRLGLLQTGEPRKLATVKDPFVMAAQRVWKTVKAEERKLDARTGELALVALYYADAMRQVLGGLLAPDANASLRITYGTVKSFKPTSKAPADSPFTTAAQIVTKDQGKAPFDAPKRALEAIKAKQYGAYASAALGGELPVNFLSDLDTTGGNSGSATLNDKGELVGVVFDSTFEGVASDFVFDGPSTRKVHVDVRYLLWVMDLLDGADHLIKEMGITPKL